MNEKVGAVCHENMVLKDLLNRAEDALMAQMDRNKELEE